jgi:hypothetical protein
MPWFPFPDSASPLSLRRILVYCIVVKVIQINSAVPDINKTGFSTTKLIKLSNYKKSPVKYD